MITRPRPISEIAGEILKDWKNIYFGAIPYLNAMFSLNDVTDSFGMDSGRTIVAYFLSNATTWKGEKAREIKKELNKMIKK
jgi:hypothetical protein